jgi:adenine-specific DNA-methyltransferase
LNTPFHSKYHAAALTLRGPSGAIESLSRSIANSRVDLNPHQVDAALFAIHSPLTKGVLLADEVGLGKTVEAGIVITQRWAERRRKILLILPATLRKQWQQELTEKFSLPSVILEGRGATLRQTDRIAICSYHFAASRSDDLKQIPWDLVVVDEAHRLRNVWKTSSKIAQAIAEGISHAPKVLMTATPLQNSLVELYGLVSILDPRVFGDIASFRDQFLNGANSEAVRNLSLKERLAGICTRTLRKQVLEYIKFTQRVPLTQDFLPTDDEQELYRLVSQYLQRETLYALPASQRTLLTLVLRKLLASSTFAIAGTLNTLVARLEAASNDLADGVTSDFEDFSEVADEWPPDSGDQAGLDLKPSPDLLKEELTELRRYAALAERIRKNSKGEALLTALSTGMAKAAALGAPRKAVVFTESRRTQQYLFDLLTEHGFAGRLVLINGDNSDPYSKAIYDAWLRRNAGSSAVSGSRTADMKAALVEEFRERATILIATESAAEGVNLQFCSLVINYDLPWNPQRIEQRIGRCHRYGQKHDVVVVNFLNRANAGRSVRFRASGAEIPAFRRGFRGERRGFWARSKAAWIWRSALRAFTRPAGQNPRFRRGSINCSTNWMSRFSPGWRRRGSCCWRISTKRCMTD